MKDPRLEKLTENIDGRYLCWHGKTSLDGMNKEGDEFEIAYHSFGIFDTVGEFIQIEYAAEMFGMFIPGTGQPVAGKLKDEASTCGIFDLLGKLQKEGMVLQHIGFFDFNKQEGEEKQDA